ncbi:hypothetical protein KIS1582_3642 [Cytobacillus firmus]|uniref:Uncharacterized protein n=1 Tax=Cytobacillus firmus TaxID=1399 RepID=A0A800MU88_CYTFI|nr:hypothetical protein KIS1582_3642 [Cytobacillus firmus]
MYTAAEVVERSSAYSNSLKRIFFSLLISYYKRKKQENL